MIATSKEQSNLEKKRWLESYEFKKEKHNSINRFLEQLRDLVTKCHHNHKKNSDLGLTQQLTEVNDLTKKIIEYMRTIGFRNVG